MRFWAGLYADVEREMLINGVNTMLREAARLILTKNNVEGQKCLKLGDEETKKWTCEDRRKQSGSGRLFLIYFAG